MSARKKRLFAAAAVSALLLIAVGAYAARHLYTKTYGVELTPSRDFSPRQVTYYLQNDPKWGDDAIGDSGRAMKSIGCLISCVAGSMCELGVQITPGQLNSALTEIGGYERDNLIWHKLNDAFPDIDYKYSRIFTSDTIESDLENGLLPIVNVKYKGGGVTHWVIIVGAENGEFMVYDPLNSELEPIPLSAHGRVYAYRTLIAN